MTKARKHHFVPQHLLNAFSDERGYLHCYDKSQSKKYKTTSKGLCAERDFHAFTYEDFHVSYEDWITQIENRYYDALEKVWRIGCISGLTNEEVVSLCMMTAFQFVRTKGHREFYKEFSDKLHDRVSEIVTASGEKFEESKIDDDKLKITQVKQIKNSVPVYTEYLLQKHIFIAHAPSGTSFWLGDNPVTMHNDRQFGPYGNIGFKVPGIQIYFPISSTMMLAFWCPSIIAEGEELLNKTAKENLFITIKRGLTIQDKPLSEMLRLTQEERARLDKLKYDVCSNGSMELETKYIPFHNSKQLGNAYRHVLCNSQEFDELEDMLRFDKNLGKPPQGISL